MDQDKLIIGFTGTRDGMTDAQRETVEALLKGFRPEEVHHGDCVGSDEQFHNLVVWETNAQIIIHPPIKDQYRAWCDPCGADPRSPMDYLDRNRDIVDECDLLIAAPESMSSYSGGTWYTIRCAYGRERWVLIVRPDGSIDTN